MPPVPQRFSSSNVLPKYSKIGRLTNSSSPPGVKAAMKPGMLSTIRRDSRSLSRSAFSARLIINVGEQDVPAKNSPAWIAEGKPAHLTPMVDAIGAPYARFKIVWIA